MRVAQVMTDAGPWLQVRPVGDASEHCATTYPGLRDLDVGLWVRREELAPVTTRDVRMTYADGTSVMLTAGVPVVPIARFSTQRRPVYTVYVSDLLFNTWVDESAISDHYRPTAHVPTPETDYMLAPEVQPVFGGAARMGHRNFARETDFVYARADGAHGSLVALRRPCASFEVRVSPAAIVEAGGVAAQPAMGASQGPVVAPGTTLVWPDGTRAAYAARPVQFDGEVEPHAELRCLLKRVGEHVDAPASAADGDVLTLCAPAQFVSGERPAPPTPPTPTPPASPPPSTEGSSAPTDPGAAPATTADAGATPVSD
jgi:hypothetical protein